MAEATSDAIQATPAEKASSPVPSETLSSATVKAPTTVTTTTEAAADHTSVPVSAGPTTGSLLSPKNYSAYFSTGFGKRPYRQTFPPYDPPIARGGDLDKDAKAFVQKYRAEYSTICRIILPPHDINDFWDAYDIHLHGPQFLNRVLNRFFRENVHAVRQFAIDWSRDNVHRLSDVCKDMTQDPNDPLAVVKEVFTDKEVEDYDIVFLWHVLFSMRQGMKTTIDQLQQQAAKIQEARPTKPEGKDMESAVTAAQTSCATEQRPAIMKADHDRLRSQSKPKVVSGEPTLMDTGSIHGSTGPSLPQPTTQMLTAPPPAYRPSSATLQRPVPSSAPITPSMSPALLHAAVPNLPASRDRGAVPTRNVSGRFPSRGPSGGWGDNIRQLAHAPAPRHASGAFMPMQNPQLSPLVSISQPMLNSVNQMPPFAQGSVYQKPIISPHMQYTTPMVPAQIPPYNMGPGQQHVGFMQHQPRAALLGDMTNALFPPSNPPRAQAVDRGNWSFRQHNLYNPYGDEKPEFGNVPPRNKKSGRNSFSNKSRRVSNVTLRGGHLDQYMMDRGDFAKSSRSDARSYVELPGNAPLMYGPPPTMSAHQNYEPFPGFTAGPPQIGRGPVGVIPDQSIIDDPRRGCGKNWIGEENDFVNQLFVPSLDDSDTEDQIKLFFEAQARVPVSHVKTMLDKNGKRIAYVHFHRPSDARQALSLDKTQFGGRELYVQVPHMFYDPRKMRPHHFYRDNSRRLSQPPTHQNYYAGTVLAPQPPLHIGTGTRRFSVGRHGSNRASTIQNRDGTGEDELRPEQYSPQDARSGPRPRQHGLTGSPEQRKSKKSVPIKKARAEQENVADTTHTAQSREGDTTQKAPSSGSELAEHALLATLGDSVVSGYAEAPLSESQAGNDANAGEPNVLQPSADLPSGIDQPSDENQLGDLLFGADAEEQHKPTEFQEASGVKVSGSQQMEQTENAVLDGRRDEITPKAAECSSVSTPTIENQRMTIEVPEFQVEQLAAHASSDPGQVKETEDSKPAREPTPIIYAESKDDLIAPPKDLQNNPSRLVRESHEAQVNTDVKLQKPNPKGGFSNAAEKKDDLPEQKELSKKAKGKRPVAQIQVEQPMAADGAPKVITTRTTAAEIAKHAEEQAVDNPVDDDQQETSFHSAKESLSDSANQAGEQTTLEAPQATTTTALRSPCELEHTAAVWEGRAAGPLKEKASELGENVPVIYQQTQQITSPSSAEKKSTGAKQTESLSIFAAKSKTQRKQEKNAKRKEAKKKKAINTSGKQPMKGTTEAQTSQGKPTALDPGVAQPVHPGMSPAPSSSNDDAISDTTTGAPGSKDRTKKLSNTVKNDAPKAKRSMEKVSGAAEISNGAADAKDPSSGSNSDDEASGKDPDPYSENNSEQESRKDEGNAETETKSEKGAGLPESNPSINAPRAAKEHILNPAAAKSGPVESAIPLESMCTPSTPGSRATVGRSLIRSGDTDVSGGSRTGTGISEILSTDVETNRGTNQHHRMVVGSANELTQDMLNAVSLASNDTGFRNAPPAPISETKPKKKKHKKKKKTAGTNGSSTVNVPGADGEPFKEQINQVDGLAGRRNSSVSYFGNRDNVVAATDDYTNNENFHFSAVKEHALNELENEKRPQAQRLPTADGMAGVEQYEDRGKMTPMQERDVDPTESLPKVATNTAIPSSANDDVPGSSAGPVHGI